MSNNVSEQLNSREARRIRKYRRKIDTSASKMTDNAHDVNMNIHAGQVTGKFNSLNEP